MTGEYIEIAEDYDSTCDPSAPRSGYLLCSTPRSGSTLLSSYLIQLGLGVPAEYLDETHAASLMTRWVCGNWSEYSTVLTQRRTRNGQFGLKAHWYQLKRFPDRIPWTARAPGCRDSLISHILKRSWPGNSIHTRTYALLRGWFGINRFIRITRRNRFQQTISYWVAQETGRWRSNSHAAPLASEPEYEFSRVFPFYQRILAEEEQWDLFFRRNRIQAFEICYEDLATSADTVLKATLSALDASGLGGNLPKPQLRKQGTIAHEALARRFEQDLMNRCSNSGL